MVGPGAIEAFPGCGFSGDMLGFVTNQSVRHAANSMGEQLFTQVISILTRVIHVGLQRLEEELTCSLE